MKKTITLIAFAIIATISIFSCKKEGMNRNKSTEIKNITLDVVLSAGEIYNMDLSPYGVQHAECNLAKEVTNISGSKLTVAGSNPFSANYTYTANAKFPIDQVIIQVNENGSGKDSGNHNGHNGNDGKTEKCGDKQPHPAITNITINFTVRGNPTVTQ